MPQFLQCHHCHLFCTEIAEYYSRPVLENPNPEYWAFTDGLEVRHGRDSGIKLKFLSKNHEGCQSLPLDHLVKEPKTQPWHKCRLAQAELKHMGPEGFVPKVPFLLLAIIFILLLLQVTVLVLWQLYMLRFLSGIASISGQCCSRKLWKEMGRFQDFYKGKFPK